jgi:hypothetical protein
MGSRWLLNAVFIGFPTFFVILVMNILNLIFNLAYNHLFAQGNVFWIGNWLYFVINSILIIPVVFEIEQVLVWIRPIRLMAIWIGLLYNFLYAGAVSDLLWLYFAEDKADFDDPQGWGDMVVEMIIAYNLVECLPNLLLNTVLILKEFSFPLF